MCDLLAVLPQKRSPLSCEAPLQPGWIRDIPSGPRPRTVHLYRALILFLCLFAASVRATNWYVAAEATGGLNVGLSWANAWTRLSSINWALILPGDTLWISGGPSGTTNIYVGNLGDASGTSIDAIKSNPITIKTAQDSAHNGLVQIMGGIFISKNYWIVDGSKTPWIPVSVSDTYNVPTNCNIDVYQTNATDAVQIFGTGTKIKWVHVAQMTQYDDNAFSVSSSAPRPVGDGTEIAYCCTSDVNGYGIRAEISNFYADTYGQLSVHHNLIEGTHDNYIQISSHVDIYKNIGRFQHFPTAGHPDVMQELNVFVRCYDNIWSDSQGAGFYVEANDVLTHDILVYNNVFYATTNGMGSHFDITGHDNEAGQACNLSNFWIFNNTIYNKCSQGQTALVFGWNRGNSAFRPSGWVSNMWFMNNCIIGVAPYNTSPMLQFFTNEVTWNGVTGFNYNTNSVRVDYNCITMASGLGQGIVYGNGGAPQVTNAYRTMASFAAATQYKSNNNDTATFVSLPAYDFRIGAGDTALTGRATNLLALLGSIAPECGNDILGNPRGASWDIGAYQHDPSGTNAATAPGIAGQPQSATNGVGSSVMFSVAATGTMPVAYQWRFNGANSPGASQSTLAKSNVQMSDAGSYCVVVVNAAGSITSAVVALTVTNNLPPAPGFYVATTGSNSYSTTQARSPATPWRTIQYAVNLAQPGDTIWVAPGNYDEYIETARSGTQAGRITIRAYPANDPANQVITKQFRVKHQYITIEGFNIAKPVGASGAMIRIESPSVFYNGSDCIITNNTIRDGVILLTRTASFGSNYIHIRDAYEGADFNTAGFVPGATVYFGSDSLYPYTNCGATPVVSGISADGLTMYFTSPLAADSGTNYWAAIVAGGDGPTSWKGVLTVAPNSGYPGVSNIVVAGNTFSNLIGVALDLARGNSNVITRNFFTRLHGGYAMRIYAANSDVGYNTILDSTNIIWWAGNELTDPRIHPSGGQYYDWQCNLTTSGDNAYQTNIDFHHNWIQNCENQLGEVDYNAKAGNYRVRYCVFVGVMAAGNGSMNNLTYDHCTFYRNCYEQYAASVLHLGALTSLGQTSMTNLTISSNVFVNNGGHYSLSQEAPYSLTSCANPTLAQNYSVFGETMGWSNTPALSGTFGSGDPLFVNASDPLGPDGLAFTDDDGLRPLPNSPIAVLGLGALPPLPATSPIAHFTARLANPGWKDATGTSFNPAYAALKPHERTGVMRPWATPDALGDVPLTVTFDASQSIDGFGTNNTAITTYSWQFSDGGTFLSAQQTVSHTFLTPGTNWVTLSITNSSGAYATYINAYRTLRGTNTLDRPQPPFGVRVVGVP